MTNRYKIAQLDPLVINEFRDGQQFRSFFAEGSQFSEEYAAWIAEGNIPDPPDPPSPSDERPTIAQRIEALELLIDFLLEPTP